MIPRRFRRWPVRWRLAIISAALTFVTLVIFAVIVGRLTSHRLNADFTRDTRETARSLALESEVSYSLGSAVVRRPDLDTVAGLGHAAVRIVTQQGVVLARTKNAPDLGPPRGLVNRGVLQVASVPIRSDSLGPTVYVQYARSREALEGTINRLWLFLGLGVLGGTVLATLSGLTLAGRAMRPIASLTSAAREIAATGDPSRKMPEPETDDEIAELARTLEQMLRTLDASRAETQRAMQKQREFVADASHELRTPLTSVLANLELLQASLGTSGNGNAEESETVESALRSSRRMRRLVSDLLLLAQADSGRVGERRPCDLAEVVAGAVAEVDPVAANHSIMLHLPEQASVTGNADELHRIVSNLVENAVAYTPAGSSIEVTLSRDGDRILLEVADNGPGIPAGLEEKVFERFVRGAGPADTAVPGGAGLGLAIVRAIAEAHGGRVWVTRSELGGAGFRVELPVAVDTPDGAATERKKTGAEV